MREIVLGGSHVNDESDAFVIAELGANHEGSLDTCIAMVDRAAEVGVSCVKLQKRSLAHQFTDAYFTSPYVSRHSFGATYGEHRAALEFGYHEFTTIRDRAHSRGLAFAATAFDIQSLEFVQRVGVDFIKLASGDLTNRRLVQASVSTGIPVVMSTGAALMEDVERAYGWASSGKSKFALLQCTSGYPTAFEELDLRVIETYRNAFPDTVVGLSSHEVGYTMSVASYVLGARIIERHFTLNRTMRGSDQALSLAPDGMRRLVRDLSRIRSALGDGQKSLHDSEVEPIRKQRKSPVVADDLRKGHALTAGDLELRSPNLGIEPYEIDSLIGQVLNRDMKRHDYVTWTDVVPGKGD